MFLKIFYTIFYKVFPVTGINKADRGGIHMLEIRHIFIIAVPTLAVWVTPGNPPVHRSKNILIYIVRGLLQHLLCDLEHLTTFGDINVTLRAGIK